MRSRWRVLMVFAVSAVLACGQLSFAGDEPGEAPGLGVGEKAPAFELKDAEGTPRGLTDLRGSPHLALVFYRSADW